MTWWHDYFFSFWDMHRVTGCLFPVHFWLLSWRLAGGEWKCKEADSARLKGWNRGKMDVSIGMKTSFCVHHSCIKLEGVLEKIISQEVCKN